jgi:hypothetical protein
MENAETAAAPTLQEPVTAPIPQEVIAASLDNMHEVHDRCTKIQHDTGLEDHCK